MKLKILIVINSAWAAYNFRLNLANYLLDQGFEVSFLIPQDMKYSELIAKNFKCYFYNIQPNSSNPFSELNTFFSMFSNIVKSSADVCLIFSIKPNIYGSLISVFLGKKYINNISGLGTAFLVNSFRRIIIINFYKLALKKSSCVFFQNMTDMKFFRSLNISPDEKSKLIPGSGVDLKYFSPTNTPKNEKNYNFTFIGRLVIDKGIKEYLKAIDIVLQEYKKSDVNFSIVGDYDAKNPRSIDGKVFSKIRSSKRINFYSFSDDVRVYIERADCIVLPSHREGMPKVILEAFSMKKNVIVSDAPGCKDLVEDMVDGLICETYSAKSLAKTMIKMLTLDKDFKNQMRENARKKVEVFYDEKLIHLAYSEELKKM